MTKDEKLFSKFLERNLPSMAPTFDEGIGIASERYFVACLQKKILQKYKIKSVLETPSDGLMGIPGMNSVFFARGGAKVTLASPSEKLILNAKKFWKELGLLKKVDFVTDKNYKYPFKKRGYDLVWNYCIFERFDKDFLLPKMINLSKKYVLIITQNKFNWGYPIHRLYHRKNKMVWDHGYSKLMDMFYLKRLFKKSGLKIIESGCVDIPPWLDTFDMHTRGLGKKLVRGDNKWYWSSLQKGDLNKLSKSRLIRFLDFFRKILFFPLNYIFAHHFYILAKKGGKNA